jgi:hypothetical protein
VKCYHGLIKGCPLFAMSAVLSDHGFFMQKNGKKGRTK